MIPVVAAGTIPSFRSLTPVALALVLCFPAGGRPALAAAGRGGETELGFVAGSWAGTSTCVGKRPACRNETVVYRFVPVDGHPGQVRLYADKVLSGRRVPMGTLLLSMDGRNPTVRGEFRRGQTHGEWSFTVSGDSMTGRLVILPERSVGREVSARRTGDSDLPPPPPLSDYE